MAVSKQQERSKYNKRPTDKNLKKFTKENAKEMGKRGGRASGISKRKKKKMREAMEMLLSLPVSDSNKQSLSSLGLDEKDADNQMLMLTVAFKQALKGNVRAMNFIKSITGATATTEIEKEKLKIEKEKLKIAQAKLELERAKLNGTTDSEVEDDGFLEALTATVEDDWPVNENEEDDE